MARSILLLCAVLALSHHARGEDVVEISKPEAAKVLTTDNFEHLTQASTGATTGDWFVKFYAPWCGHCKRLVEPWEELAQQMKEERANGEAHVVIAKVDATIEKYLGDRFEIRGFPTLLLFSQGKMYTYSGPRTTEAMAAYAKGGFKETEGVAIPLGENEMPLPQKLMKKVMKPLEKDMRQIWKLHKLAFFLAGGGFFLLGLIVGCCLKPSGGKKGKQD